MVLVAAPVLQIRLAGPMQVLIDGRPVPVSSRKALAILVYLALQSGHVESRERLAALLWSESGPDQSRGALRQTLRRLKTDLGTLGAALDADRIMLRLTCPLDIDIVAASDAAARGELPELLTRGDGTLLGLLAELEGLDPDFDLWIAVQRERISAQLISRLEAAIAAAPGPVQRLAFAEALGRADPTHEGACRAAMQAHIVLGDTAQAMRCYERLWRVLEDDLDVEPSEHTQALYVAIKQGQARPKDPFEPDAGYFAPIAIIVEGAAVAHLPEAYRYFGTVFRDEMVASLSRFRDWLVIDGEQTGPAPPTYRAYVLRITLTSQQETITVGLMLVDQADGRCVWAERHSATLDGMSTLHQTALRLLAVALNVHLSTPRLRSAREMDSPMGRRYELWMQAQALMGEWRADAGDRAEAILRELIAATPRFAPALVALAQINNTRPIVYPGRMPHAAGLAESLDLTARAVSIDPLDSRAHLCRSWAHAMTGSPSAALSHLDLALDLNENDPWTIMSAALGFAFGGDLSRARSLVDQAGSYGMRYSRAVQGYIATTLFLIGDFDACIDASEVAGDVIINLPAWQAVARLRGGDPEGAARTMARFLDLASAAWTGPRRPTEGDIIDWFMACFPIRETAVRSALHRDLVAAIAEKKRRLG